MMNPSKHEDRSHIQVGPKQYSSADLISITSNFLESNRIGSGAYAEVYKGHLSDDICRAVKKLNKMDVVEDTFAAELRTMGNAVHHNLVKLYGYCFEDHMKALVYEYMENGSLDKILYENNHGGIEWAKLYAIAIDIANGLRYLHHDLEEPIIHHDIKAANVLLDKKFSAKIADFGLARIMSRDVSRVDLTTTRGTPGYIAPEVWMPGSQVTCKCDVFSFGMMLFEVLGKRKNGVEENWLPGIVWKRFENRNLENFIKSCGIAKKDTENANILCKVALWCVQDNPDLRPSMKDVVLMLEKEKQVQDPPFPFNFWQAFTPMVVLEESCRENIDREWSDKMELDPTYPQNIIARPSYASVAGSDGEVTLPQLKMNKHKTQSPNMMVEFAVELTSHGNKGGDQFSDESLALMMPKKGMTLPTESVVGETTALRKSKTIWECLMDDEISTIGVYGMGGVGKTTIMKEINNRLLKENRFDKVIWVTVSQDASTQKLQKDIAIALSLDLSNEQDPLRRSGLLLEAWERSKRIVLILDDMWQEVSLTKIGIAEPNKENGCKLVLTTRVLEVCRRMKCGKRIITVECLSPEEAWKLFINKVDIELAPEVQIIAKEVAKECACLPLAIITVGGAMSGNDDIIEWRFALAKLKESNNEIMNMERNVFKCLKFSYDRLPDDRLRKCFLYCALYPEDRKIFSSELIDFWIVEGLITERNRQDELDQGHIIVNTLKNRCLLESCQVPDQYNEMASGVKMHDLIRDMAINITNQCFMVKSGGILEDVPDVEEWGDILERASFMKNNIKELSISPKCPQLSTLLLAENPSLHKITDDFFVFMKGLKVLDLRENENIESLPTSISALVNLRALRLSRCKSLISLPSLAKLQFLRILDLNHTAMEELPHGIEKLDKLACLDLSMTRFRETIPAGIISKLSSLQKLDLSFIDLDKLYSSGNEFQFIEELLSLKELEDLIITFRSLSDCAGYVGSSKFKGLKDFCFVAGENNGGHDFNHPRRTVRTTYPRDNPRSAHFLPPNTESFHFRGFNDFKRLYELECLHDVPHLRECEISGCAKMECILSSEDENQATLLKHLENIVIQGCPNFFTLYKGIPNLGILPCLRNLTVYSCHNLKNLFSSSQLLQSFLTLEQISVGWCDEMEELIGDEMGEGSHSCNNTTISLPCLKKLSLSNLYKLKRIWRGDMACNSLPRLKKLSLSNLNEFKSICTGDIACNSLQKIIVSDCHKLKTLFSISSLQHLQNLEEIVVRDCVELEKIIVEDRKTTTTSITLTKLSSIYLSRLPRLTSIWMGKMVCESLKRVQVYACFQLKSLPQLSGEKESPPPAFTEIIGRTGWWDSLKWDQDYSKNKLQPFFRDR